MSTELAERPVATIDYAALEKLLLHGDTSELGPAEKINYYEAVCKHVGLDWLTQPFRFMKTHDGKEQLYPTKECAAQLRRIHHLDTKIIDEKIVGECYVVRARVQFPSGRGDEDNGAVNLAGLKGQALADAMMKCATKAKRRATLSACGLGMLDSSEVETIPGVRTFSLEEATKDVAATAPPPVTAADTPKLSGPTVTFLDTGTGEEVTVPKPTPKFPYYVCSYKLWPNGWHEYMLLRFGDDGIAISLVVTTKVNITEALKLKDAYDKRLPVQVAHTEKHGDTKRLLQEVHIGPKLDQPF